MVHTIRDGLALLSMTALVLLVFPLSLAGQEVDDVRADRLVREATSLQASWSKMSKAAGLYEEATGLREEGDERSISHLMLAGSLRYYAGQHARARTDFEKAAVLALEIGDVVNAAESFLKAAVIAQEQGDAAAILENSRRAELLANSPLLSETQRAGILGRIQGRTGDVTMETSFGYRAGAASTIPAAPVLWTVPAAPVLASVELPREEIEPLVLRPVSFPAPSLVT